MSLFNHKVKDVPALPGVYLMKDKAGNVIYVGKARNLNNRIRAYFGGSDSRPMIPIMVSKINDIDFIITGTEKEALILENSLIKKYRPRYNVIFKDDKSYFKIQIDLNNQFSRFELVRQTGGNGVRVFGPYPSSREARETLRFLHSIFPVRTCKDHIFKTRKRPCIEYGIKRCLAPCVGMVDPSVYRLIVNQGISFLEGRTKSLITDLRHQMNEAADRMCFEEAAIFRDRICAIEGALEKQRVVSMISSDRDVFGVFREGNITQIVLIYVRAGKITGKREFPILKLPGYTAEIISSFIQQYYDASDNIPQEIFVPYDIDNTGVLREWLSEKRGGKVSVVNPRRGEGKAIVRIAETNAKSAYHIQKRHVEKEEALKSLAKILKLEKPPVRIECFDVSNIGGDYAVGAMVTFIDGRPWKQGYRRYKIKHVIGADDYAMMYEIIKRRYIAEKELPDLIVVDGGKGQLGVAISALKDIEMEGNIIAIAKDRTSLQEDRVYIPRKKNPLYLSKWPAVLFLLQSIRNEAHRFALNYYRKTKEGKDLRSLLDQIPGIGETRKKLLLTSLKGIGAIKEASIEDLRNIRGIGPKIAEKIFTCLKEKTNYGY